MVPDEAIGGDGVHAVRSLAQWRRHSPHTGLVGDVVNTTSRVDTRRYGTDLLVTDAIVERLKRVMPLRFRCSTRWW